MSFKSFALVGLSSLVLVVGCGSSDDSKPAAPEGTPNKQGASTATSSTITAVQTAIKPAAGGAAGDSGQASANQLATAAQATQNLVTPAAGGTAAKSISIPGLELADLLHPLAPTPGQTGTCTCTADSCTFAACSNGSVTIDGTYSFGGGHIKATALKYTINVASGITNAAVVITIDADITATATSINGSFHSAGSTTAMAGGQSYSSTWDSTLEFKAVTFPSGGGAPTGGSEHVAATTNVTAGGASQAYQSNFDVTFPAAP
jgi:hypothetical protein